MTSEPVLAVQPLLHAAVTSITSINYIYTSCQMSYLQQPCTDWTGEVGEGTGWGRRMGYQYTPTVLMDYIVNTQTPPAQAAVGDDHHECKWSSCAS